MVLLHSELKLKLIVYHFGRKLKVTLFSIAMNHQQNTVGSGNVSLRTVSCKLVDHDMN